MDKQTGAFIKKPKEPTQVRTLRVRQLCGHNGSDGRERTTAQTKNFAML
jgi:hypothetical protein